MPTCIPRGVVAFLAGAALSYLIVADGAAQEAGGWRISFAPYGWIAGMKGRVGVGRSVAEVDLSAGDILDQLDIALMGVLEARRDRWIGRLDGFYVGLSDDAAVPLAGGATGEIRVELDQVMLQPEVGYSVLARPWGGVDGLVGVRYWHLSADLSASVGGTRQPSASESKDWVDGTVGARIRVDPGRKWHLFAKGDVGGGGSEFTWQALGGAAWDFARCCSAIVAYRHLDVDYESAAFVDDVYMTGPALGVGFRF